MTPHQRLKEIERVLAQEFSGKYITRTATDLYRAMQKALRLAREGGDGWMPIESAPGNKEDIQLYCEDTQEQFVGFRYGNKYCFAAAPDGARFLCNPSHWQPLPSPPKEKP